MNVIEKVHVCIQGKCSAGKAVCCAECFTRDTCDYASRCWDDPKQCSSYLNYDDKRGHDDECS